MEDILQLPHRLTLDGRESLTMTGVTEVVGFDDTSVICKTHLGVLTILGSGLTLKALNVEDTNVAVSGHIDALSYEEPRPAGLWQRLFG